MKDILNIKSKIFIIRGQQIMLDSDLSELYEVETKALNQAVKRNKERFPKRFMFQLTKNEFSVLRSQFVTSKIETRGGRQYLPYAFTEQGIAMLSAVLRSEVAIKVSLKIMDAFIAMRKYLLANSQILQRLDSLEIYKDESKKQIDTLFSLMDKYKIEDKHGIYFQGQIYDAYSIFQKLIHKAQKEIILIDNYIDLTVLDRLSAKNKNVNVTIYTKKDSPVTPLDVHNFNIQYPVLDIKHTNTMHDRFLIIDNIELYHIGASLKDLGKKCFAFEQFEDSNTLIPLILQSL